MCKIINKHLSLTKVSNLNLYKPFWISGLKPHFRGFFVTGIPVGYFIFFLSREILPQSSRLIYFQKYLHSLKKL